MNSKRDTLLLRTGELRKGTVEQGTEAWPEERRGLSPLQSPNQKGSTHIRLQSLGPPAIAVELGRLHRLSQGDAVGFVFFVLLLIIKWTCVALLVRSKG